MTKHPMQKIVMAQGVARFQENTIIRYLLDSYPGGLNDLCVRFHNNQEDYEQLTMLIGYSVAGFGDLSTSNPRRVAQADRKVAKLLEDMK